MRQSDRRFIYAFLIIIAVMLVLALYGCLSGRWDEDAQAAQAYKPGVQIECLEHDDRELLVKLSIAALDEAFHDQIKHLYSVWMRDLTDQPRRAQVGATVAIQAWLGARESMGKFQPECPKNRPAQ